MAQDMSDKIQESNITNLYAAQCGYLRGIIRALIMRIDRETINLDGVRKQLDEALMATERLGRPKNE